MTRNCQPVGATGATNVYPSVLGRLAAWEIGQTQLSAPKTKNKVPARDAGFAKLALMKINGNPHFPLGGLSADFRQWEEGQRLQAQNSSPN